MDVIGKVKNQKLTLGRYLECANHQSFLRLFRVVYLVLIGHLYNTIPVCNIHFAIQGTMFMLQEYLN